MNNGKNYPAVLVFSDDWGRHPSSCQHLIRQLLDRHQVYWVNTIGTRRPRLDWATAKRGWEKIRHWTRKNGAAQSLPKNLQVLTPRMWPSFSSHLDRKLNRELLHRQLSPLLRELQQPIIAVTTIPIVADLVGLLPVDRWVYYCVDDFGEWPGLDRQTMQQMEEALIEKVDLHIAVSDNLQRKLAQWGKDVHLLTHGVDLEFWNRRDGGTLPQLDGLERPLVVFWGVIDRRMDVAFVRQLAADMTAGTIVFVGPDADPDPELLSHKRAVRLPPLPFDLLPHLAHETDVLIMPYADLPVTRAMQPLKFKEYLATGKPAVVRDLPATRDWADAADLVNTPRTFSRAVRLRLESGLPQMQTTARRRLRDETWNEKARLFANWLFETELPLESVNAK